jgi:hypothetical protein
LITAQEVTGLNPVKVTKLKSHFLRNGIFLCLFQYIQQAFVGLGAKADQS